MRVEKKPLFVPDLKELCQVLQKALQENYEEATVEVVQCPDLTQAPWSLASPGICGQTRLIDVGGPAFLAPTPCLDKFYSLADVAALAELPGAALIGAGAGCHRTMKRNSELIADVNLAKDIRNSHVATVNASGGCDLQKYTSYDFSLLCNLLASEGSQGPVLRLSTRGRRGAEGLVTCMRKAIAAHFGERPVGLGGVFAVKGGTVHSHVMPDFSKTPLDTQEKMDDWLNFYDVPSPLTCLSVLVSHDMDMKLRLDHTHFFSTQEHGWGGHYHYDIDSANEKVVCDGVFVPAHFMYRIDEPCL